MKILVVSWSVRGHFNAFIPIVEEASARGHKVDWCCFDTPDGLGAEHIRTSTATLVHPPQPYESLPKPTGAELAEKAGDDQAVLDLYETITVTEPPLQVESIRRCITKCNPEIVLVDTMMPQAHIACRLEAVPFVGVCMGPKLLDFSGLGFVYHDLAQRLAPRRVELFERFGLSAPPLALFECLSPWQNVMFGTNDFIKLPLPPRCALVGALPAGEGPASGAGPSPPRPGRRFIYVSFGTLLYHQPALLQAIIAHLERQDHDALVVAGDLAPELATAPSSPVRVVDYADQRSALAVANAFITHGGANSVMEALTAGVPMVVAPLGYDQPIQAWLIEQAGVGLSVDATDVQCIGPALERLFDDGRYENRSRALGNAYRATNGAAATLKICESLK